MRYRPSARGSRVRATHRSDRRWSPARREITHYARCSRVAPHGRGWLHRSNYSSRLWMRMRKLCDTRSEWEQQCALQDYDRRQHVAWRWYRSLYWRIAIGVVAFLAAMLVVQAMLFVWTVSQTGRTLPGQSPGRLGMTVAIDLAQALERDPQTDLAKYVKDQFAEYNHPFFVMMKDGRLITSGSTSFPDPLIQMARARLERGFEPGRGRGEGPRPEGPPPGRP